ncbi:MAG: hypothetical protein L0154_18920 [Chloroflexi bacterium]|nr:hypothetical protein [Chloroflexota bacterium]
MLRHIIRIAAIVLTSLVLVVAFQRQSPTSTKWLAFTVVPGSNAQLYRLHAVHQRTVPVSDLTIDRPAMSPDGRWLAFSQQTDRGLSLMKAPVDDLRNQQILSDGVKQPIVMRWSPDNQWIAIIWAYGTEVALSVLNVDSREYTQISTMQVSTTAPVWSPDSTWLYYAAPIDRESTILRSNINTSETEIVIRSAGQPALSSDGTRLAYVEQSGSQKFVTIVNVETGAEITQVPFFSLSPFWGQDGSKVYFSDFRDGNLWEFNLDTSKGQQLTFRSNGNIYARLWDDECLIAEEITHGNVNYDIYLLRICGQTTTLLTPDFDLVYGPFWMPHIDEAWHPWALAMGAVGLGGAGLIFRRR